MLRFVLFCLALWIAEIATDDALEGSVRFVFKPMGGERMIRVPNGNRLALVPVHLSLAPGERLVILDGPCADDAPPSLVSYSWRREGHGDVEGTPLFSTGAVVCIRYGALSIPGAVQIDYRAFPRCGGKMNLQEGDIVNPTYPGPPHKVYESCDWTVEVEYGQRIHVEVRDFSMTLHHNYVILRGISGYDPQQAMLTLTKDMPMEYTTDFWDFSLSYTAGKQSTDKGFWIHYQAIGCAKKDLPKPKNGLWSSYRDYLAFGHVMYMTCPTGYAFPSGVNNEHYSMTCQKDRTWSRSWEGELENCVKK